MGRCGQEGSQNLGASCVEGFSGSRSSGVTAESVYTGDQGLMHVRAKRLENHKKVVS